MIFVDFCMEFFFCFRPDYLSKIRTTDGIVYGCRYAGAVLQLTWPALPRHFSAHRNKTLELEFSRVTALQAAELNSSMQAGI